MARNMITGKETQKMQEYTQEQIDRAEHMEIEIPADVKEQIFEYANLIGEEEKVRTLVRNLADAVIQAAETAVAMETTVMVETVITEEAQERLQHSRLRRNINIL